MNRALNKYDILKAFAILLVVIGHITILYNKNLHPELNTEALEKMTLAIYIFHMPLFMSLSGSVYQIGSSIGKYQSFSSFLRSKLLRIIVPYLCIGLFILSPTLAICNGEQNFMQLQIYKDVLFAINNKHLWFLLALFWIFLFQYSAECFKVPTWMLFCISAIVSTLLSIYNIWFEFLDLAQAIHYWPYFIWGILIEKYSQIFRLKYLYLYSLFCLILCGIGYYMCDIPIVNSISITLLPCFIIIILTILAAVIQQTLRFNILKSYITILVNYSFGIYLFHVSVIFLMSHYFHDMNVAYFIPVTFILAIIIPISIVSILRKFNLHFVIGEKQPSKGLN